LKEKKTQRKRQKKKLIGKTKKKKKKQQKNQVFHCVHSDTLYVKKTKETKARKKNKTATVKNLCVKKNVKKNKKKKTAIEK